MKKLIPILAIAVVVALISWVSIFSGGGPEAPTEPVTGCLDTYNEAVEQWDALSGNASLESYLLWDDDKGIITSGGFDMWDDKEIILNLSECYFGTAG